ncbi:MAG: c-type cytochrome [Acidobacteriota bacterium]
MALAAGLGLSAARADKGQQVYAAQRCSMCHAIAGKGNAKNPLDDVGGRMTADERTSTPLWLT